MDVNAAIAEMLDLVDRNDYEEAADIARNIKRWVCIGGFVPTGYNRKSLRAVCNRIIDLAG